jgi:hypothetical protein
MADRYAEHAWSEDDAERMITTAADGTRLELLKELRTRIVAKISDPKVAARDLSSLTLRLVEITGAIAVEAETEDFWLDKALVTPDEPFDPSTL